MKTSIIDMKPISDDELDDEGMDTFEEIPPGRAHNIIQRTQLTSLGKAVKRFKQATSAPAHPAAGDMLHDALYSLLSHAKSAASESELDAIWTPILNQVCIQNEEARKKGLMLALFIFHGACTSTALCGLHLVRYLQQTEANVTVLAAITVIRHILRFLLNPRSPTNVTPAVRLAAVQLAELCFTPASHQLPITHLTRHATTERHATTGSCTWQSAVVQHDFDEVWSVTAREVTRPSRLECARADLMWEAVWGLCGLAFHEIQNSNRSRQHESAGEASMHNKPAVFSTAAPRLTEPDQGGDSSLDEGAPGVAALKVLGSHTAPIQNLLLQTMFWRLLQVSQAQGQSSEEEVPWLHPRLLHLTFTFLIDLWTEAAASAERERDITSTSISTADVSDPYPSHLAVMCTEVLSPLLMLDPGPWRAMKSSQHEIWEGLLGAKASQAGGEGSVGERGELEGTNVQVLHGRMDVVVALVGSTIEAAVRPNQSARPLLLQYAPATIPLLMLQPSPHPLINTFITDWLTLVTTVQPPTAADAQSTHDTPSVIPLPGMSSHTRPSTADDMSPSTSANVQPSTSAYVRLSTEQEGQKAMEKESRKEQKAMEGESRKEQVAMEGWSGRGLRAMERESGKEQVVMEGGSGNEQKVLQMPDGLESAVSEFILYLDSPTPPTWSLLHALAKMLVNIRHVLPHYLVGLLQRLTSPVSSEIGLNAAMAVEAIAQLGSDGGRGSAGLEDGGGCVTLDHGVGLVGPKDDEGCMTLDRGASMIAHAPHEASDLVHDHGVTTAHAPCGASYLTHDHGEETEGKLRGARAGCTQGDGPSSTRFVHDGGVSGLLHGGVGVRSVMRAGDAEEWKLTAGQWIMDWVLHAESLSDRCLEAVVKLFTSMGDTRALANLLLPALTHSPSPPPAHPSTHLTYAVHSQTLPPLAPSTHLTYAVLSHHPNIRLLVQHILLLTVLPEYTQSKTTEHPPHSTSTTQPPTTSTRDAPHTPPSSTDTPSPQSGAISSGDKQSTNPTPALTSSHGPRLPLKSKSNKGGDPGSKAAVSMFDQQVKPVNDRGGTGSSATANTVSDAYSAGESACLQVVAHLLAWAQRAQHDVGAVGSAETSAEVVVTGGFSERAEGNDGELSVTRSGAEREESADGNDEEMSVGRSRGEREGRAQSDDEKLLVLRGKGERVGRAEGKDEALWVSRSEGESQARTVRETSDGGREGRIVRNKGVDPVAGMLLGVLDVLWAQPQNAEVVQSLTRLSVLMEPPRSHVVLAAIHDRMLKVLWKNGSGSAVTGSAEEEDVIKLPGWTPADLLALSPFLALKVLPLTAWNDTSNPCLYCPCLNPCLYPLPHPRSRTVHSVQTTGVTLTTDSYIPSISTILFGTAADLALPEVTWKLAADLAARLHPLPLMQHIVTTVQRCVHSGTSTLLRSMLYILCTACSVRGGGVFCSTVQDMYTVNERAREHRPDDALLSTDRVGKSGGVRIDALSADEPTAGLPTICLPARSNVPASDLLRSDVPASGIPPSDGNRHLSYVAAVKGCLVVALFRLFTVSTQEASSDTSGDYDPSFNSHTDGARQPWTRADLAKSQRAGMDSLAALILAEWHGHERDHLLAALNFHINGAETSTASQTGSAESSCSAGVGGACTNTATRTHAVCTNMDSKHPQNGSTADSACIGLDKSAPGVRGHTSETTETACTSPDTGPDNARTNASKSPNSAYTNTNESPYSACMLTHMHTGRSPDSASSDAGLSADGVCSTVHRGVGAVSSALHLAGPAGLTRLVVGLLAGRPDSDAAARSMAQSACQHHLLHTIDRCHTDLMPSTQSTQSTQSSGHHGVSEQDDVHNQVYARGNKATVHDQVNVLDKATVHDQVDVPDRATAHDQVMVHDKATVHDQVDVRDKAAVHNQGNVHDKAILHKQVNVRDTANLHDQVTVHDKVTVHDQVDVHDEANVHERVAGGCPCHACFHRRILHDKQVAAGCCWWTCCEKPRVHGPGHRADGHAFTAAAEGGAARTSPQHAESSLSHEALQVNSQLRVCVANSLMVACQRCTQAGVACLATGITHAVLQAVQSATPSHFLALDHAATAATLQLLSVSVHVARDEVNEDLARRALQLVVQVLDHVSNGLQGSTDRFYRHDRHDSQDSQDISRPNRSGQHVGEHETRDTDAQRGASGLTASGKESTSIVVGAAIRLLAVIVSLGEVAIQGTSQAVLQTGVRMVVELERNMGRTLTPDVQQMLQVLRDVL